MMSRGGKERKAGRHKHTTHVINLAGQLAVLRNAIDGMTGEDPDFDHILSEAENAATDLSGVSLGMDRGAQSRRAACENVMTRTALVGAVEAI